MFTQDENVPSSENYANTQKPLNSIRQVWWMEEVCGITAMLSKPTWLFARHSYEGRMISTTFLLKLAGASEYQMNNRVPWQHSQCATNISTSHVRKDKNTHICQIWWIKYKSMFWHHNRRWMLHNCWCWNGKLCSRPLYQWSIQSFSFQNSWLQKYISVWEARH